MAALVAVLSLALPAGAQSITVAAQHPRLGLGGVVGGRTFDQVRQLYLANGGNNAFHAEVQPFLDAGQTDAASQASYWVLTGNTTYAANALTSLSSDTLTYRTTDSQSDAVLQWACAYDWACAAWPGGGAPANFTQECQNIESQISTWVSAALTDLDKPTTGLWQRRSEVAAAAWTASLVLPAGTANDTLRQRAFADWQQSLLAVNTSPAWPEGAGSWSSYRSTSIALGVMAYRSAVTAGPALSVANPTADLRNVGLWQLYTYRPDGQFNNFGTTSPSAVLSQGVMGRSIDSLAVATGDASLAALSDLVRLQKSPLYVNTQGWLYPLTYPAGVSRPANYDPLHPEVALGRDLAHSMIFGRDSYGLVASRQGWGATDTQVLFKAGDFMASDGHYDQGAFTMYKRSPLVVESGVAEMSVDGRENYYMRTVSSNCILVQRPNEVFNIAGTPPPPSGWANDGGQRLIAAGQDAIGTLDTWKAGKASGSLETGNIMAYSAVSGDYSYTGSDLTRAYSSTLYDAQGQGGKVSQVTRQMLYLEGEDALIVFDRVASTDPSYQKKWLLHTPNKMLGGSETLLAGSGPNDGILLTAGSSIPGQTLTMTNGQGRLFLQTLLPASYSVAKIGGPDYRHYVETDGNDANGRNGVSYDTDVTDNYSDPADWRIEISPDTPSTFDTFLNVLTPRDSATASVTAGELLRNDATVTVMELGHRVVGFGTTGHVGPCFSYFVDSGGTFSHLLVDMTPGALYRISDGGGSWTAAADSQGVLRFSETAAAARWIAVGLANPVLGDANGDGAVDQADYDLLHANYGQTGAGLPGDFNNDDKVDGADYTIWADHYSPATGGDNVPEPATIGLLAAGAALLGGRRNRQRLGCSRALGA